MTGSNWAGFGDDVRVGKQFFVLLNEIWPRDYEPSDEKSMGIVHPIEKLFHEILCHARG